DGIKQARIQIGDLELNVASVSGLKNARELIEQVRTGKKQLHFIEVMTCPGGCIAGGGQPLAANFDAIKARMKLLYDIDRDAAVVAAHNNRYIKKLYQDFLGTPLSEKSHHLLHTRYQKREVML
ncbi:MAG: iron hydrogenase small subunit, partial [candidate division KSB1 bacterium]|nr:iron hydrogenase small subunit [candidate division KSB1 bacterium]